LQDKEGRFLGDGFDFRGAIVIINAVLRKKKKLNKILNSLKNLKRLRWRL